MLGRLHPLLVHLPIGFVILAVLLQWSLYRKQKSTQAMEYIMAYASIATIISCISGYVLSLDGGHDADLLFNHQYVGITTALLCILSWYGYKQQAVYGNWSLYASLVLIGVTGHLGGSMTHGSDYFFGKKSFDSQLNLIISNAADAKMYNDVVAPILQSKCYACHSSKKQKGDLRLDDRASITKGGKHGDPLLSKTSSSSLLLSRIVSDKNAEGHMPPKSKEQLSTHELALIKAWIADGASFEKTVKQYAKANELTSHISALTNVKKDEPLPIVNMPQASQIKILNDAGFSINTIAKGSGLLHVSALNVDTLTDAIRLAFDALASNMYTLDFGGNQKVKKMLTHVNKCSNLSQLYLQNLDLEDNELEKVINLLNLKYLNLTDNTLTDQSLKKLEEMKGLQQLFLYKNKVSKNGVDALKQVLGKATIDTGGYQLQMIKSDTVIYK